MIRGVPLVFDYLHAFYDCDYKRFFTCLFGCVPSFTQLHAKLSELKPMCSSPLRPREASSASSHVPNTPLDSTFRTA